MSQEEDLAFANSQSLSRLPIFHGNHYLIMKLKSHLISQYGNAGKSYAELPDNVIERKINLCDEFIEVFSKFDGKPGETDWWASTMYERVRAEMIMDQRRLDAGKISMKLFMENVTKSIDVWLRIAQILRYEPEGSYLRTMATRTEHEIKKAKELLLMAQFL